MFRNKTIKLNIDKANFNKIQVVFYDIFAWQQACPSKYKRAENHLRSGQVPCVFNIKICDLSY